MKVQVRCGRVREMSKQMNPDDADGENLGIEVRPDGAAELVTIMDRLVAAGNLRDGRLAPSDFAGVAAARDRHAGLSLDRDRLPRGLPAPCARCCRRSSGD